MRKSARRRGLRKTERLTLASLGGCPLPATALPWNEFFFHSTMHFSPTGPLYLLLEETCLGGMKRSVAVLADPQDSGRALLQERHEGRIVREVPVRTPSSDELRELQSEYASEGRLRELFESLLRFRL